VPTYVYACTACEHRFEAQQAFTDDALTDCPECTGRLRKLFNSVGIVFKGSGFYRNDSRGKSGESTGTAAAPAASSSDSSTSSGSKTPDAGSSSSSGNGSGTGSKPAADSGSSTSSTGKSSAKSSAA
jgi:putative FmdB family regulatory protein